MTTTPTPREVLVQQHAKRSGNGLSRAVCLAFADADLSALAAAGYAVVPKEPTPKMLLAADFVNPVKARAELYRAMVAAAEAARDA